MVYIPTLLGRNNIRDSIKDREARALNQSIFEFAPTSDIAQDYYTAVKEIWQRAQYESYHGIKK